MSFHRDSDYCYDDGYDDDVPLHRKQAFGAGLKRKRVEFVRAKDDGESAVEAAAAAETRKQRAPVLMGDLYASIVLGGSSKKAAQETHQKTNRQATAQVTTDNESTGKASAARSVSSDRSVHDAKSREASYALASGDEDDDSKRERMPEARQRNEEDPDGQQATEATTSATTVAAPVTCPVCALPITGSVAEHNASLAHQVSLEHSHPPSALDRSRMGLRALKAQGWDPDARRGLGRDGEGLRYPLKTVPKDDNLGIGAAVPKSPPSSKRSSSGPSTNRQETPATKKPLGAKEMRRLAEREKKKSEALHRELYARVDVERYLKGGSSAPSGLK